MLGLLNAILRPLGFKATKVHRWKPERPVVKPKAAAEPEEDVHITVKTAQVPFAPFARQVGGRD